MMILTAILYCIIPAPLVTLYGFFRRKSAWDKPHVRATAAVGIAQIVLTLLCMLGIGLVPFVGTIVTFLFVLFTDKLLGLFKIQNGDGIVTLILLLGFIGSVIAIVLFTAAIGGILALVFSH